MRWLQAVLFVGVYIGLGFAVKPNPNAYLLMGIPLTLLFQVFVRKQPLYTLWLRDATEFKLRPVAIVIAITLAIWPAYRVVTEIREPRVDYWHAFYFVAAVVGALGAGYCFTAFTKQTLLNFLMCWLITGSLSALTLVAGAAVIAFAKHTQLHIDWVYGIKSMLTYVPIGFVVEEVVFRGTIDAHVYRLGERNGILSAFFVSALWGLWHLPIIPNTGNLIIKAVTMIIVHSIPGIPLSIYYRKTGNLAVPHFSHAFMDAVRNMVLAP